jgi:hypothetical protein
MSWLRSAPSERCVAVRSASYADGFRPPRVSLLRLSRIVGARITSGGDLSRHGKRIATWLPPFVILLTV